MKLNDTTTTVDIAQALSDEAGSFIVTAPDHGVYLAECQPGHSLTSLKQIRPAPPGALPASNWQITKVSDSVLSEEQQQGRSNTGSGRTFQPSGSRSA